LVIKREGYGVGSGGRPIEVFESTRSVRRGLSIVAEVPVRRWIKSKKRVERTEGGVDWVGSFDELLFIWPIGVRYTKEGARRGVHPAKEREPRRKVMGERTPDQ